MEGGGGGGGRISAQHNAHTHTHTHIYIYIYIYNTHSPAKLGRSQHAAATRCIVRPYVRHLCQKKGGEREGGKRNAVRDGSFAVFLLSNE